MICVRLNDPQLSLPPEIEPEDVVHDPGVQYNIGRSQKCLVHIPTFLQKNKGDPAIKVSCSCIPSLLIAQTSAELFTKVKKASTSLHPNDAPPGSRIAFRAF